MVYYNKTLSQLAHCRERETDPDNVFPLIAVVHDLHKRFSCQAGNNYSIISYLRLEYPSQWNRLNGSNWYFSILIFFIYWLCISVIFQRKLGRTMWQRLNEVSSWFLEQRFCMIRHNKAETKSHPKVKKGSVVEKVGAPVLTGSGAYPIRTIP